jgi:hypothetical protein
MFLKRSLVFSSLLMLAFTASARAAKPMEMFTPALVKVAPDHVYAPMGFDDNDNAQIVLDGELSDTCYKLGPTEFVVNPSNHTIVLKQQSYYYPGAWCDPVHIPYVQTVNLGILPAGKYQILVEQPNGSFLSHAELPVALSTSLNPDDFLYAPVSNTFLKPTLTESLSHELVLSGIFSTSCMHFKDVKLHVRSNQVIEVMPIVEMTKGACAQMTLPFEKTVSLENVPHGRYLLHIRVLNGQSINRVLDL